MRRRTPAGFVLSGRAAITSDWPLERDVRQVLARRKGFNPDDRDAISVWDTSLETLLFGRMIDMMRRFFSIVGVITLDALVGDRGLLAMLRVRQRHAALAATLARERNDKRAGLRCGIGHRAAQRRDERNQLGPAAGERGVEERGG